MKKFLLALALVSPMAAVAGESVYAWGPWTEGVKPAAGPAYVAPSPVAEPTVEMRESIELLRQNNEIQYSLAPGVPQVQGVLVCSPACPSGAGGLGGGNTDL